MRSSTVRTVAAILGMLVLLVQGTWVLAGTTGAITGVLTDAGTGKPISGARVYASSPSQSATTSTDQAGRYSFLSLAPDTYTLSFEKQGYQPTSQSGVTVQADQSVSINASTAGQLQTIGRVGSRSATSLVRPGQTASEYSVSPAQQIVAAPLGGGTNLNSAYSAIASVPGVVIPLGNAGWGQSIFIRGGDYTQTGNEVDGIPINRSFDQYSTSALSSLGNQEVQVYTGNAPADAQAVGLAGFVNQVIKTGTYPASVNAALGVGAPAVYNHANLEIGGASSDRLFSYYAATGGYSQQFRLLDQYNGTGYLGPSGLGSLYNYVAANCTTAHPSVGCYSNQSPFLGGLPFGPNGYSIADLSWFGVPYLNDRETLGNIHIGLKHPHDGNHDDIQLLYDYGNVRNYPNTSMDSWGPFLNDIVNGSAGAIQNLGTCPAGGGTFTGVPTTCAGPVSPVYLDQNVYTGPLNQPLTAANLGSTRPVLFASSPGGRPLGAPIDFARQDGETNQFAIFKAQYQHNIGDKAYLRLYGYTLYSDRIDNGIVGLYQTFVGSYPQDYTISSHSRGVVLNSGWQVTSQNLVNLNVGYVTSNTDRFNNLTAGGAGEAQVAYLVNANNPAAGCYSAAGLQVSCSKAAGYVLPGYNSSGPLHPKKGSPTIAALAGMSCGGGPCEYLAVNNGYIASNNTVTPKFLNASIGDTWKPNSRLSVDLSLRMDSYSYVMQNTDTLGNQLFVNDYNQSHCVSGTSVVSHAYGTACPTGYAPTALSASSPNLTYAGILQPRAGATYQTDPYNVFRASYGRFVQPAQTSAVQATSVQAGAPSAAFYSNFGFASYARAVAPEISYNTDLSWEHQFRGSDTSTRVTPFYRKTQNEFATILVDPKTNFVAEVNGQNRTASGVEFALTKGDFTRDGLAAQFSYTYTYAYNQYKVFPNGGSFVTGINQAIGNFNSYTSFCGSHPSDPRCTAANSPATAAPCYLAGAADPTCAPGSVANPYYNMAPQSLLDPNGKYFPYNQAPGYGSGASTSYLIPHVASLIVQWKKNRFAITPSLQFEGGSRYGSPLAVGGVAPDSCSPLPGANPAGDPRYAGTGITAGSAYDASSCTGNLPIPDPFTRQFDGIGQFVQPNLINANLQLSYDVSKHLTLQITAANIYSNCFGGSKVPWNAGGRLNCSYANGLSVGNFYNPGDVIQPGFQYPYAPVFGSALQALAQQASTPFMIFFELKVKGI